MVLHRFDVILYSEKDFLMKKLLPASAAVLLSAPAFAADLPSRTSPPPPPSLIAAVPAASWSGLYLGLNFGGMKSELPGGLDISGYTFGARLGYDHQFSSGLVVGLHGDADISTAKVRVLPLLTSFEFPAIYSINARIGFIPTRSLLLYATGGYSYADVKVRVAVPGDPTKGDGYNIGLGAEYRFTPSISGYAEYRFAKIRFDGVGNGDADVHAVKVGLNYRFSSPAATVVARY